MVSAIAACASSKPPADGSTIGAGVDVETMRPPEAAQIVEEFQQTYGVSRVPPADVAVTSMAQVVEIIEGDRLADFEEAREFTAGRQGSEALTVRSYLETSYAGALLLAASILDEERRQNMTELRSAQASRPFETTSDRSTDQSRAARLQTKSADLRKVVRALNVLSEEPLTLGSELAQQAIRQDPRSELAYLANANYYRLRGSWLEFDRMMQYANDTDTGRNPAVKTYLRAMEAHQRYADDDKCRQLLQEALVRNPNFVRAQANLVLVERDIEDKYAQLQKLRTMNPNHIVVRLAGPMIDAEYATDQELDGALKR